MKKKILIIFLILLVTSIALDATCQMYNPSKIIPPTPSADALSSFGNYNIGYNTGTPVIDIPLYSIKLRDNLVKIHLKYNATGIKVAQQASWVGLGWSLIAGGTITRIVRGKDDFKDNLAYYAGGTLPPMPPYNDPVNPAASDKSAYDEIMYGRVDGEPDLFNYSFGNYAGSFVLGKKIDGSIIYYDEVNDLKLEYNGGWTATDAKGYKYIFGTQEAASNYSYSSTAAQVSPSPSLTPFAFESLVTTAWYLDSIVSPTGETISFTYTRGQSLSLVNGSETQYDRVSGFIGCPTGEQYDLYYKFYNASRQLNNDVYLNKITFPNGSIEFNTTARSDIDYNDANQVPAKLSVIKIFDKNHQILKSYNFDYTYFNPNYSSTEYNRLKLDAITETDQSNNPKPPYKFTYDYSYSLPSKYSLAIDHWGFYNGAANTRLLPMPQDLRQSSYNATDDANREADTTNMYIKAGVLTAIQYPTGGHTTFDYQLDDYSNLTGSDSYVSQSTGIVANANPYNQSTNTNVTFDITQQDAGTNNTVPITFYYQYSYVSDTHQFAGVTVNFGDLSGPQSYSFDNSALRNSDPEGKGGAQSITFNCPAGHYTLSVRYIQGYSVSVNASWTKMTAVTQKTGGGLRLYRMTNYDYNNKTTVKKYLYTTSDGKSSGVLINKPIYGYRCPGIPIENTCYPSDGYICRMSAGAFPQGLTSKGGIVGYNQVTELIGENGEGGKTEYYYINAQQLLSGYPGRPDILYPGVPLKDFVFNGRLKRVVTYNVAGQPLTDITNFYSVKQSKAINGVQIYQGPPIPVPPSSSQAPRSAPQPYNVYVYQNPSTWAVLDSTKQIEYLYMGTTQTSNKSDKHYYYDNPTHLQLTRTVISDSRGRKLTQATTYPDDYASGTNFLDDMKNNHLIGLAVEQASYLNDGSNNRIVDASVTNYKTGGKGLIDQVSKLATSTPVTQSAFKFSNSATGSLPFDNAGSAYSLDNRYQARLTYNQYDNLGNPLQVTQVSGSSITYLWGYNNQYPVAEIRNASYLDVAAVLTQASIDQLAGSSPGNDATLRSTLNKLRTDSRLSKAQVTTYTYDPLVGMTSSTDSKGMTTTYEYDSFQRLLNVKDMNGNIVKHNDYHYQNQ